jgi:hypothetical protein
LSGSGGTSSLGFQSGHAPGKDGVGEVASIMLVKKKEKEKQRKGEVKEGGLFGINDERVCHCSIEGSRIPSLEITMYL